MPDETEEARRILVNAINSNVESDNENKERKRLEDIHAQVWTTDEVQKDFEITGFLAPFCTARRKSDNVKGTLMFQHRPRFYFGFSEDKR